MTVDGVAQRTGATPPQSSGTPKARDARLTSPARTKSAPVAGARAPRVDPPVTTDPRFVVDGEAHTVTILIVDRESGKVIRQIPPEEVRELAQAIERQLGVLFESQG